jgi:hypothetical protein
MSLWILHKDKQNQRHVYAVDVPPFVIVIAVGILATILIPNMASRPVPFALSSFVITGIGFLLFLASKLSLISKGRLFSFGTKAMSKPFRVCYYLGYVLIVLGALGALVTMVIWGGKG